MTPTEHRQFKRKQSLHLLDYLVIDRNGLQTTYSMGRTLDVSENGLKLETAQQISKGDTLLITVGLEDDLVDLRGEVIHSEKMDNHYITGVEFRDISEEGKKILKGYTDAFHALDAEGEK